MNNNSIHITYVLIFMLISFYTAAQNEQESAINYTEQQAIKDAQDAASDGDFAFAEAEYKKALSLNPDNAQAAYNLGNLYYNNEKKIEANSYFRKAADAATSKEMKHKIFHNIGNTLLENKDYDKAIEAYKNALRNDPTDDETRYNLALAKQEKEKQGGGGGGGNDENDQNQQQEKEQEQDKNKEGDQDEKSDGDNKGDQNEKEGDQDKNDGDQKNDDQGKNSEGENGNDSPEEQKGQAPQRQQGKMTRQQIKQLLEAMNNEEKKIQKKVNGKKAKGTVKKSEKDW